MRTAAKQLEFAIRSHGGRRPGAGRKPKTPGRPIRHGRRPVHDRRHPVHVTLCAVRGLPSLRGDAVFAAIRTAFSLATRPDFRLLHFSVQSNHVHLLVEANDHVALRRGLQGLAIRVAKAIDRALARCGKVWSERYHARALETPTEYRYALAYVLQNVRKHDPRARGVDARSSGPWFTGWSRRPRDAAPGPSPVGAPTTWIARIGWRPLGAIDLDHGPRHCTRSAP